MIGSRVRTYLNQDKGTGLSIFKEKKGFLVLLLIPDVLDIEQLEKYCSSIAEFVSSSSFTNAMEFDEVVSGAFKSTNLPLSFSISCLFRREDTVFLKTFGVGEVVLRREGKVVPLVKNGAYASGKVIPGDEIALSIGNSDPFHNLLNAVHIEYGTDESIEFNEPEVKPETYRSTIKEHPSNPINVGNQLLKVVGGRKLVLFSVVLILGIFLFLNVMRSYLSKTAQADRLLLENSRAIISQKLAQAEDVFELNSGRSIALLSESKKDLKNLERQLNSSYKNDLNLLSSQIAETEKKILKKNVRQSEEFIDLGLEKKGAQGTAMWRYEDRVIVLNPKGAVYILSLEKKSLDARSSASLTGISLAGLDDSTVYTYKKGTGIIKVESEVSKPAVVIKQDKDWGNITDLQIFNKNIYLLDSDKGQIFKYIPTENGFATKSAYFKSVAYAQNAKSFAIDQSVYVAQMKLVTKYTSGYQDGFAPQYPDSEPTIARVLTGSDSDELYLWDKIHGRIVILSKTGDYRKTIESSIFSKATSVEVFADAAYALLGSKIYKASLK